MFPNFTDLIATKTTLCRYLTLQITYIIEQNTYLKKNKLYIYIYVYILRWRKNKETILSSLQACFVITHISGDYIVNHICNHQFINFTNFHNRRGGKFNIGP